MIKHILVSQWFIALIIAGISSAVLAAPNSKGFTVDTLDCVLTRTQNPSLVFDAKVDKTHYKVGEFLVLDVSAEHDLYATILDHGSDPAKPHRSHTLFTNVFIKKGSAYQFPPPNAGDLEVSEPLGRNTLEVIASVAPLKNVEAASKNVNLVPSRPPPTTASLKTTNCTLSFTVIK